MTKKIEIIKALQKIAQNEHVEFAKFRKKFIKYCNENEDAVFDLLRYLTRCFSVAYSSTFPIHQQECTVGKF